MPVLLKKTSQVSILAGAVSIFDLFSDPDWDEICPSLSMTDEEAIFSDWLAVFGDLQEAVETLEHEEKEKIEASRH